MRFEIKSARELGGAFAMAYPHEEKIVLSSALFKKWKRQPVRYWKHLLHTILHELAHIQVGPNHGHDRAWRERAMALGASGRGDAGPMRTPKIRWMVRGPQGFLLPCGCTNRTRGIDHYHPSYTCKFKTEIHYRRTR